MLSQFAEFLDHLQSCDRCSAVDLDLCSDGERLKAGAWRGAADRIASIVPVVPKQSGEPS